ncbi:MAG: hypothetical protein IJS58_00915 [Bacilli bacterium]|nr:hypothetical protein [Bacilli bacterium]
MKLLVKGEHNFFLFQDIAYYYIKSLSGGFYSPIKNKHSSNSSSYYIYNSWLEVLKKKVLSSEYTDLIIKVKNLFTGWMITTNIAILTSQKERKDRDLSRYDFEYLEKYKPIFLIEHCDNYNSYLVHLDGDYEYLFTQALDYYNTFINYNYENVLRTIKKYFVIDENDISKEIEIIVNNFEISDFIPKMLESYEKQEDNQK